VLATDEKKEVGDRRWVECVRYSVRFASVGWFSLSIGQRLGFSEVAADRAGNSGKLDSAYAHSAAKANRRVMWSRERGVNSNHAAIALASSDHHATTPQPRSNSARSRVARRETTMDPKQPSRFEYSPIMFRVPSDHASRRQNRVGA